MLKFIYNTDTNMNLTIFTDTQLRESIKALYIQQYGEYTNTYDVILEKDLDSITIQGTFFNESYVVMTGFHILRRSNTVRMHFKLSKNANSLNSAKKLYKQMLYNLKHEY